MPFKQKIEENNCQIAIWDMSESVEELLKHYHRIDLSKFKTELRKKEFISSRILLNIIHPSSEIIYNLNGAPEIKNNNWISISHSKNLTAIILSKNRVGLDIEKISEKTLKISPKFILKDSHQPLSKEKSTLIWCAKEAIYKWNQEKNISFIYDIIIKPFKIEKTGILMAHFKGKNMTLHYKKLDAHFLVYVCKMKNKS